MKIKSKMIQESDKKQFVTLEERQKIAHPRGSVELTEGEILVEHNLNIEDYAVILTPDKLCTFCITEKESNSFKIQCSVPQANFDWVIIK